MYLTFLNCRIWQTSGTVDLTGLKLIMIGAATWQQEDMSNSQTFLRSCAAETLDFGDILTTGLANRASLCLPSLSVIELQPLAPLGRLGLSTKVLCENTPLGAGPSDIPLTLVICHLQLEKGTKKKKRN